MIDRFGWEKSIHELIKRHLAFNHHHEVIWLLWLLLSCRLEITDDLIENLINNKNAHIRALVVAAYIEGRIMRKPKLTFGGRLPSTDQNWLLNLVARSSGYTKASFSGLMADEFSHMAKAKVVLIDIQSHMDKTARLNSYAISRTRYGYDSDDYEDDNAFDGGFFDVDDDDSQVSLSVETEVPF